MFTLTYVDLEYEFSVSISEFWNDDRTKMLVWTAFRLATRLRSQNSNETMFINELWHINLYMNIGISNWYNWSFDRTKINFLLYFSSFHYYWPPSTRNSLVYTPWCKRERCEKRDFQLLKMRKKKMSHLKHKNQVRNRLFIYS